MKNLILILLVLTTMLSCKKTYTCTCTTIDAQLGYINSRTYTVKEKNKMDANVNCVKQYEASGLATGGTNCEIK